jgi:hypothetical protein
MLSEDAVAVLMLQDLATTTELCSSASMQIGFADLFDIASRSVFDKILPWNAGVIPVAALSGCSLRSTYETLAARPLARVH